MHLTERWKPCSIRVFDAALDDLTSTYFECDTACRGQAKHGHSRDKRPDCVQVVIALIVTPKACPWPTRCLPEIPAQDERLRISGERSRSNTARRTASGSWIAASLPKRRWPRCALRLHRVSYLVGTPKGRLTALEKDFTDKPWSQAKEAVCVSF